MAGEPPMENLALWRMQLASRPLVEGGGVGEVADVVGYESEAAFSRAFNKLVGQGSGHVAQSGLAHRGSIVPRASEPFG